MLRSIVHRECDRDLLVKTVDPLLLEIRTDIECQTVNRGCQQLTLGDQIASSTVGVGFLTSDPFPSRILRLSIEPHRDTGGRPSDRNIEYVCCYSAHNR